MLLGSRTRLKTMRLRAWSMQCARAAFWLSRLGFPEGSCARLSQLFAGRHDFHVSQLESCAHEHLC